jgi:cytoskeletal protein CcmA (bactofilin family)
MKILEGKINGDLLLKEDADIKGMVVGNVFLRGPINVQLHGMIIGNIEVEINSVLSIYGTVNGNVSNNGGILEVFGVINGTLFRNHGQSNIDGKAVVRHLVS